MKKILFAITVTLLLATGCGLSKKDSALLEQIEALAVESPDSALEQLSSLPPAALQNREFRSRATIAEAEAMYQNSEIMSNDSLLAEALDFYCLREKDPRRYRAYFLSGYQHYLKEEYGEAIIDYLNAEHTAALTTDTLALGLIYRAMGNSFFMSEDYISALEYYDKSYKKFESCRPNKYYWESRIDLAKAYYNVFFYDESLNILLDSINCQNEYDLPLKIKQIRLIGQCFEGKKDFRTAQKYYSILEYNYKEYLTCQDFRYMGHIAYNLGDINRTKSYNERLLNCDPTDKWLEYLISLNDKNYKKAFEILRIEYESSNDYFIEQSKSNLSIILHSFYQAQFQNALSKKESIKNRSIIVIVFSLMIVFFIVLILLIYRRKQTREQDAKINTIRDLSEIIRLKNNEITNLEKEKSKKTILFLPAEFNTLEILCNNYYTFKDHQAQKKTYNQIMEIIRKLQSGGKELKTLIDFINNKLDNLFTRFREENPNINEAEDNLFLYMLLGLSPISISVLQEVSVNQIYSRKTYLKTKIKKNRGASMEEILRFF